MLGASFSFAGGKPKPEPYGRPHASQGLQILGQKPKLRTAHDLSSLRDFIGFSLGVHQGSRKGFRGVGLQGRAGKLKVFYAVVLYSFKALCLQGMVRGFRVTGWVNTV